MSTIQTNSITDAAGTGAPDFPNGINAATALVAKVDDTERIRIDSSGHVSIGTTGSDVVSSTNGGAVIRNDGRLDAGVSGACSILNRIGSDGTIQLFRNDGVTVGAIGTYGGDLYWSGATGAGIRTVDASNRFYPCTSGGVTSDNTHDWGYSTARFNDIYATNGVTTTSDRNEKQDIKELSEAERRVAVACKGLLRKYRWKDAVAEKGDAARIHFGIIAQDLQAAFAAEGLDAGRYAMFISSTWWEHEGQTYDTAEEAPEGATERTRLGVRYPELLAFMIAVL